jgi:hypothetical protein
MSVRNLRLLRSRSQERGSTTLIAVLVLFALLGLGLLSMRHTYQDMSSVGNLRRATQARFVAEMGAHHAITLVQQQGSYLLGLRQPGDLLELNSQGLLSYINRNPAGIENVRQQLNTPPFPGLTEGPTPLGELRSQHASYRVRIEGITDGPPPPGQELSQTDLGTPRQSYCLIQVSSHGYLSRLDLPETERANLTEGEWRAAARDVAEHRVKVAITVGPFMIQGCAL